MKSANFAKKLAYKEHPLNDDDALRAYTKQTFSPSQENSILYNKEKLAQVEPKEPLHAEEPQQQPVIDKNNAIGSVVDMLGPTPAEREAQRAKMERNRKAMTAWTALFDGLRNLGNLYYTSKGARPQRFGNLYDSIGQEYQRERQLQDETDNYRRQYAQSLYNLQHQQSDDMRRARLTAAQIKAYDTKDELARMKAENDRLKTEKYVQLQDGRIAKINAETGRIEALLPLQKEEMQSRINKNNRTSTGRSGGSHGTYGYKKVTTHGFDKNGNAITTVERVPTTGNNPNTAPVEQREASTRVTKSKPAPTKRSANRNNTKKRISKTQL